jgi:hypothetical protein
MSTSTPAETLAAARAAIETADALVTASQTLVNNAHTQMTARPPTMTLEQYQALVNQHAVVIGNAATIRHTVALELGANVQQHIAALQQAANKLNSQIAALARIQNVTDRAAKVLIAAGAVATLIAAPSAITVGAAVTAVVAVVD